MNPILKTLLAVVSLVLSYFTWKWMFGGNVSLAVIVGVSVVLHEIGHGIVLRYYGHRFKMVFLPIGAAVIPDNTQALRESPLGQQAKVFLAGPLVTVVLILAGLALAVSPQWYREGIALAAINAALGAMNLIPWGKWLDGGVFIRMLFRSMTKDQRTKMKNIIIGACVICGIFHSFGYVTLILGLSILGVVKESKRETFSDSQSSALIGPAQGMRLFVLFLAMLSISLLVAGLTLPLRELYL